MQSVEQLGLVMNVHEGRALFSHNTPHALSIGQRVKPGDFLEEAPVKSPNTHPPHFHGIKSFALRLARECPADNDRTIPTLAARNLLDAQFGTSRIHRRERIVIGQQMGDCGERHQCKV
ncbi:MAG: hypothetical protein NT115_13280 [Proteobacteria bacterium]|nr:hypothetical protein [Pseudomonadota bacterium]